MVFIVLVLIFLIDWYVFQAVKVLTKKWKHKKIVWGAYWLLTIAIALSLLQWKFFGPQFINPEIQRYTIVFIFIDYLSKIFAVLFLFIDDGIRLWKWIAKKAKAKSAKEPLPGKPISRSEFLAKASIGAIALPVATLGFGIVSGAYDYRVRRKKLLYQTCPRHLMAFGSASFLTFTLVVSIIRKQL